MFPVSSLCTMSGDGCSPLQRELLEGHWATHRFYQERRVRPNIRWGLVSRYENKLNLAEPISPFDLGLVVVFDVIEARKSQAQVFNDLVPQAWIMSLVLDQYYRLSTQRHTVGTLEYLPMRGYQPSQRMRIEEGTLHNWFGWPTESKHEGIESQLGGVLRVRRIGDFIDLCVGELADGSPAVLYRIMARHLQGRQAPISLAVPDGVVSNGHVVLDSQETVEFGWVPVGEALAHVHSPVTIQQCTLNGRQPVYSKPHRPSYAVDHPLLPVIAELNSPPLTKPVPEHGYGFTEDCVPQLLFGYNRESLLRLPAEPHFAATSSVILDDLQKWVQSDPFVLTARGRGEIRDIEMQDEVTKLVYANGLVQLLPTLATLSVEKGAQVNRMQPVASLPLFPTDCTWENLRQLLGQSLPEVLAEFLLQASTARTGVVDEYLLPQSYVRGVEYKAIHSPGEGGPQPNCYLDLSRLTDFYFPEDALSPRKQGETTAPPIDAVLMPPIPRPEGPQWEWGDLSIDLSPLPGWGSQEKPKKKRRRRRNRRPDGAKQ